ncbi:MAG: hypothetical protein WC731_03115 [Candidatus Omnitrophota bacterium]|jgi:hypothetical protein
MSVDAKMAAKNAFSYYSDLVEKDANVRVEEVDFSPGDHCWIITLGIRRTMSTGIGGALFGVEVDYKTFYIDVDTGNVQKMKIREIKK